MLNGNQLNHRRKASSQTVSLTGVSRTLKRATALSFAFLIFGAAGLLAEPEVGTGDALLVACKEIMKSLDGQKTFDSYDAGYCLGFVTATRHSMDLNRTLMKALNHETKYCIPTGVTTGQLVRVVVKDLEGHPEKLHLDQYALALSAIADAFPCELKPK